MLWLPLRVMGTTEVGQIVHITGGPLIRASPTFATQRVTESRVLAASKTASRPGRVRAAGVAAAPALVAFLVLCGSALGAGLTGAHQNARVRHVYSNSTFQTGVQQATPSQGMLQNAIVFLNAHSPSIFDLDCALQSLTSWYPSE